MDRVGRDLWGWLIDMLIVGVLCGVGLLLLGVPLAFILGVIAALTNFVPFIGAIGAPSPPFWSRSRSVGRKHST